MALTREQLQQQLIEERVAPDSYSLTGGHPSERYVIDRRGESWVVYYSERGEESGLATFSTESEACKELLTRLRREPTVVVHLLPREAALVSRLLSTYGLDDARVDVPVDPDELILHVPEEQFRSIDEYEVVGELQAALGRKIWIRPYESLPSRTRPLEAIQELDWTPGS